MPITKGPWAYDRTTGYIVSTVEYEEWSPHLYDPEEIPVPMRVACMLGAMGENSDENLALIVASPQLLEALKQWKCPACGGKGTYLQRGYEPQEIGPDVFVNRTVACTKCKGTGRHPIAWTAIQLAEGTPLKI